METSLALTPSAVAKVAEIASREADGLALVVGVQPGGCSGFRYELFFADPSEPEYGSHQRSEFVDGEHRVTLLVDPASAELLRGATLRYQDGLQDAGFKIENPNAQRSCGCGQSFC